MTSPFLQFMDSNGNPLSGGKIYSYIAGTTTAKDTFKDQSGSTKHTNPVILDSAGRAQIWLNGSYKFVIKDSDDNVIDTVDNVTSFTTIADSSNSYFETFSGDGTTTVFTTSDSLGTDEKAIYVWVDAGGGKGYEIQDVASYTINGNTLTFGTAPASGTNNIYVSAPSLLVGSAAASASAADASANAAALSASEAAASAAKLKGTSITSVTIGLGSQTFTTQSDKFFDVGNWLLITSDADTTNYMHGQVTAYSGTTLTINVTNIGGSGTYADWTITVSGTQGAKGDTGNIGDISGQAPATITASDELVFADVSDSNNTKKDFVTGILKLVYPVGSYYINETNSTNPATLLGFGTWVAVEDKMIIGASATYPAGSTGGSATTTQTTSTMAAHSHSINNYLNSTSAGQYVAGENNSSINSTYPTIDTNSTGGGNAMTTISPYISAYIWKRTA